MVRTLIVRSWSFWAIKKRLELFSPRRLGSPPPELPNHSWIVELALSPVNVTLVIRLFRILKPIPGWRDLRKIRRESLSTTDFASFVRCRW
jgi:hypothetical protein